MKLKSFRIKNYKSIFDSGECIPAADFTVLIGKNESGKTSVLEALRDFDCEQTIAEDAVSITGPSDKPEIKMHFEIRQQELDAAAEAAQVELDDATRAAAVHEGITLVKKYPGKYQLLGNHFDDLFQDKKGAGQPQNSSGFDHLKAKKERLSELLNGYPLPEMKIAEGPAAANTVLNDLRGVVKSRLTFINDEQKKVEIVELLHDISRTLASTEVQNLLLTPKDKFTAEIVRQLPRFVYFSDFIDILPFEISIESVKSNQTVMDFARLAGLDMDSVIQAEDLQKRINLLSRASATISGAFLDHWKQNKIELIVRPEGNMLLFAVKEAEGTDFFKVQQRSRGFQWFLSFYLRLNRYKNDNVVILIDEPGMNLHPSAQKDILRVLGENTANATHVIFSTHSAALIEPERLDRVRFLVKNKANGSVIKSDHSEVDSETLMPVAVSFNSLVPPVASAEPLNSSLEEISLSEAALETDETATEEAQQPEPFAETEPANNDKEQIAEGDQLEPAPVRVQTSENEIVERKPDEPEALPKRSSLFTFFKK